ncbi:hypothetical protein [Paenibacillus sp. FSL L8-0709]
MSENGPGEESKRRQAIEIIEQWMKEEERKEDKDFHDKSNDDEQID